MYHTEYVLGNVTQEHTDGFAITHASQNVVRRQWYLVVFL